MNRSRGLSAGWTWLAGLSIAALVLPPHSGGSGGVDGFSSLLIPANPRGWIQLFANIALYLPLGFTVSSRGLGPIAACTIGAALSVTTELGQLRIPGRDPRAADVLANAVGAIVGTWLATTTAGAAIRRVLVKVEDRARRLIVPSLGTAHALAALWTAAIVAVLAVTAWLLSSSPPAERIYSIPGPSIAHPDGLMRLGAGAPARSSFHGLIDEVLVFPFARSTDDIRADMRRSAGAAATLASRPLVSFTFDDPAETSARDASGHGQDAEIHGAASQRGNGRYGAALALDDLGEARAMVNGLAGAAGLTVEAWIFPAAGNEDSAALIALGDGAFTLYLRRESNTLRPVVFGLFDDTDDATIPAPPIRLGEWSHVAATYDNESLRLYVNGKNVRTNHRWSPHRPEWVVVNGRALPFGRVSDQAHLDSALSGVVDFRARVVCGKTAEEAAPVFRVLASGNVNVFNLLAERDDLLIRASTIARQLGLASPDHRVPDLFRSCQAGKRIEITLRGNQKRLHATLDGVPVPVRSPSLGSGWGFFLYSDMLPAAAQTAGTAIWLAALLFPAGLWARLTSVGAVILTVLATVLVAGPAAFGLLPLSMPEFAAAFFGLAAGFVASWIARRITIPGRPGRS
jgi:hypothetical protein